MSVLWFGELSYQTFVIFFTFDTDLFLFLCSCASRLVDLESQLTRMTDHFQADRQRMANLEKELKQLREENRALIRVIAKLSRSAS